jgi:hypothetical protein
MLYSFIPTAHDDELSNLDDSMFVAQHDGDFEAWAVRICIAMDWSGVHVFAGDCGPQYDYDTGYENNYHGWIDARSNKGG